jgi:GNAT superfamily N-acetyltransferase
MGVRLERLTTARLSDFRALLGGPEFGGCFCAVWTSFGDDWASRCADPQQPNYQRTARDLAAGRHVGFLVHEGAELIAWTGAGPKDSFPLMASKLGSRLTPSDERTWAVGCIAVREAHRGRKVADAVVAAVVEEARRTGAASVEAYPVRPFHEPRVYRGTEALYRRAGFVEAGAERDGPHEVLLMRRALVD